MMVVTATANTATNNTTGGDLASSPLLLFSLNAVITEAKREAGSATHRHAGIVASDVPAANSSTSSVAKTINDENAPPYEKRAIDDLRDGFLPLGKPRRSFVGTKTDQDDAHFRFGCRHRCRRCGDGRGRGSFER
jgi:hypothetical protein